MSPDATLPSGADGLCLIKPAVRALPAYALDAPDAIRKLNQNESPADLPLALKRAITERVLATPWHRYPDFVPTDLCAALAERHGWTADGVLVGNGSNELLQAVLGVTLEPGAAAVAPAPTFALYRLMSGVLGAEYVSVPLGPGFRYDADALVETVRNRAARVVVVCTPNNPTGSVLPLAGVRRLLEETEALVVCDEAYAEFGGESAVPLLRAHSRLVVVRTFSKAFGLAGLRFGYALAHPAVAAEITKAKLPYNVNRMTLEAAAAALDHAEPLGVQVQEIVARRDAAIAALRLLPGLTVFDSAANFFLIRCETVPARTVFRRLLEEDGILVRDVSGSPALAECLRISVGTADDMAAVETALTRILADA